MSRAGAYETLDAAVFKWFLNIRSQNVPLSGAIVQDKAGIYLEKLNIKKSRLLDGRLCQWNGRRNILFKTILEEQIP